MVEGWLWTPGFPLNLLNGRSRARTRQYVVWLTAGRHSSSTRTFVDCPVVEMANWNGTYVVPAIRHSSNVLGEKFSFVPICSSYSEACGTGSHCR